MVKRLSSILVLLAFVATSTFAQFANIDTPANPPSEKATPSKTVYEGWESILFSYNMGTLTEYNEDYDLDGFTFAIQKAFPVSSSTPLFLESGIQFNYSTLSESLENYDGYGYSDEELKLHTFSMAVPFNLAFKLSLDEQSHFVPYLGLNFRGNILAKMEVLGQSYDAFDKDDVGDAKWKRFNVGWQIGARLMLNHFVLGVRYSEDLNEIAKESEISNFSLNLGFCF